MEVYIILAASIIVILLIILIFYRAMMKQEMRMNEFMNNTNATMNQEISNLANGMSKDLYQFQHDIVTNFKTDLSNLNLKTNESLYGMSKEVQKGMSISFEKTNHSFNEMNKQLVSIHETQKNLNSLSKDIVDLQNVLTDKKSRGIFGEVELYSILKSAYGLDKKFYETQHRLSNGSIADAVLFAAKPLNKIVIDSKFPLENYVRMYDKDLSKAEQKQAATQFSRDVKKHIDDIKNKYLIANETAEMAYLFIPAEAIFAEINANFQDIVHYSYEAKVYLVSPTTMMAFITALKAIYLGIEQNDKVDLIQEEYGKLALEFDRFVTRYENLNRSFKRVYRDFEDLDITTAKIVNRFDEIAAVKLEDENNDEK